MDVDSDQSGLLSEAFGTIAFLNGDGVEIQAVARHLGRHEASFELLATDATLRSSEVLSEFRVKLGGRPAYAGRATITAVTHTGARTVCAVALKEPWSEPGLASTDPGGLPAAFDGFLSYWQKYYHVRPEFKVVVADMQSLLTDLDLWLSQFELGNGVPPGRDVEAMRHEWARSLGGSTTATLNTLFEKFETTATAAGPEWRPACRVFARRQLHPLLLTAPFLHRTYRKPLGYAGDYEMVNMISRDPHEGKTLFAKLVNVWFLAQPPAEAHRNRLKYLEQKITDTALRVSGTGRPAKILSLGCGPAVEVQEFLRKQACADRVEFSLIDFNQETLDRTRGCIEKIKQQNLRSTPIDYIRKSVMGILRETPGQGGTEARKFHGEYDFVYCAGLFDYLTDPVCRRLSTQLYEWVRPGGLFLSTNVHNSNPWPLVMDFIMDWHLIYRSSPQMLATRPEQVAVGDCTLIADATGVNVFLETRKPELNPGGSR